MKKVYKFQKKKIDLFCAEFPLWVSFVDFIQNRRRAGGDRHNSSQPPPCTAVCRTSFFLCAILIFHGSCPCPCRRRRHRRQHDAAVRRGFQQIIKRNDRDQLQLTTKAGRTAMTGERRNFSSVRPAVWSRMMAQQRI